MDELENDKQIILKLSTRIDTDAVKEKKKPLLNAFLNKEVNLYDFIKDQDYFIKKTKKSYPVLRFNYSDGKLYTLVELIVKRVLTKKELEDFSTIVTQKLKGNFFKITIEEDNEIEIEMFQNNEIYTDQTPISPPEDYYFLKELLLDNTVAMLHNEFLNDAIWFEHLKKICDKEKMPYREDAPNGAALPVYKKETSTDSVIVHKKAWRQFEMWSMAQNYIQGFPKDHNNHNIGLVMYNDIKFADFVYRCALRQAEEGKDPDEKNFNDEFQKALNRINKN